MSRFKREHSAGATSRRHTLFFSFSSLFVVAFFFVRAQTQRDRRRRLRRRLRFLLRVSFRLLLSLGGVSLFQKSFRLY